MRPTCGGDRWIGGGSGQRGRHPTGLDPSRLRVRFFRAIEGPSEGGSTSSFELAGQPLPWLVLGSLLHPVAAGSFLAACFRESSALTAVACSHDDIQVLDQLPAYLCASVLLTAGQLLFLGPPRSMRCSCRSTAF